MRKVLVYNCMEFPEKVRLFNEGIEKEVKTVGIEADFVVPLCPEVLDNVDEYSHLIISGSEASAMDESAWTSELTDLIRKFVAADKKLDIVSALSSYIPESIISPFANNVIISVVLLAILFGMAARRAEVTTGLKPLPAINFILKTLEQTIHWVIKLVPLAIFGVTAKTVGEYGFTPFVGLLKYLGLCIGGLTIHAVITYHAWILGFVKISLKTFWGAALKPVIHAFGTNSSLATVPLTLKCLDDLGISKSASRLGTCVGTNLNNDGVLLYEVAAAIFLMQAFGQDIGLAGQLNIALLSVLAAIGIAGIPEAGIISLSLVLSSVGLPLEALPLLLTVDWLIARCRSVVNVLSDMTVSLALHRWENIKKN